ncbi:hypothetical protein C8F01DRAFT_1193597 [Mycena amicta]|nr:hypothetical protein C8F01DRAFT_1193597 [Mycena amicta]
MRALRYLALFVLGSPTVLGSPPLDMKAPDSGVSHQIFHFSSPIVQHESFTDSVSEIQTVLIRLADHSIWQYTRWQSRVDDVVWIQRFKGEHFLDIQLHPYSSYRAYLLTNGRKIYSTTDQGRTWNPYYTPTRPNSFGVPPLHFHTKTDEILWIGDRDCGDPHAWEETEIPSYCHAEVQYTQDNGRKWSFIRNYVRNCDWGLSTPTEIWCESYRDKTGMQRLFQDDNPLALIRGEGYFLERQELVNSEIAGFTNIGSYSLVAKKPEPNSVNVDLFVWDGVSLHKSFFPQTMGLQDKRYTILSSTSRSVFLHQQTRHSAGWGTILKSNANGTRFSVSAEYVNRDTRGFVDFEGSLEGVWRANIVVNPRDAMVNGEKELRTKISFNDGSTWEALTPPKLDSAGQPYSCVVHDAAVPREDCSLHLRGYTHSGPEASYREPGLVFDIGNVGASLTPYTTPYTAVFMTRNAGRSWEEIRKGAYKIGVLNDGAVVVLAPEGQTTDRVWYSLDLGRTWQDYQFDEAGAAAMRVNTMVIPRLATRRVAADAWKVVLLGEVAGKTGATAVHLDFSPLAKPCNADARYIEPWILADGCLLGQKTRDFRRSTIPTCNPANTFPSPSKLEDCTCTELDFECELGFLRNPAGQCVRIRGTQPTPPSGTCDSGDRMWYEPPAYRKISLSSCVPPDSDNEPRFESTNGIWHPCPAATSEFFWLRLLAYILGAMVVVVLVLTAVFVGILGLRRCLQWYHRERKNAAAGNFSLDAEDAALLAEEPETPTSPSNLPHTGWSASWFRVFRPLFHSNRGGEIRLEGDNTMPVATG